MTHDCLPVVIVGIEEEVDRREYAAGCKMEEEPGNRK